MGEKTVLYAYDVIQLNNTKEQITDTYNHMDESENNCTEKKHPGQINNHERVHVQCFYYKNSRKCKLNYSNKKHVISCLKMEKDEQGKITEEYLEYLRIVDMFTILIGCFHRYIHLSKLSNMYTHKAVNKAIKSTRNKHMHFLFYVVVRKDDKNKIL
jgi:hypothetical protein